MVKNRSVNIKGHFYTVSRKEVKQALEKFKKTKMKQLENNIKPDEKPLIVKKKPV